jgi:hypothetical protein
MASNRSTATTRSAAHPASAETSRDALAALLRDTARIQIAAVSAAGNTVGGWAHAADRFAQTLGDELFRRIDGESDSRELVLRVAKATNAHLRELTRLPSTATDHFNTRLARVSTDN